MVSIISLWLPILLSAVVVFLVSSIIHMVFQYHKNDFAKLPSEDTVMDDLRKHNIPPGDYHFPRAKDMKDMKSPEYVEKMKQGPSGMLTLMKSGPSTMGKELVLWFIYSIIVGIFAAYIAGNALDPGEHYLSVFRYVGATAFVGYSLALVHWSATLKSMFDGLIYALFTAGVFGWLWPV